LAVVANVWILSIWAGAAVVTDWRSRRLPNLLTMGGMVGALSWLVLFSQGPAGAPWEESLLAGAIAAAVTVPSYMLRAMGAGDVKLSIAMGLLGGLQVLLVTMVLAGIIGGVLALWLLATRRSRLGTRQRSVPFGSALGIGFVTAIWALPVLY